MALLYDQSIPFIGDSPQEGDLVVLRDGREFEVSTRRWSEGGDGAFRLEVLLTPWPCYDGGEGDDGG